MPTPDSLKAFYTERARVAHAIEHVVLREGPEYALARYDALQGEQGELASLERAFARAWRLPSADAVLPLPWCNVCGRNDRALLPGRMLCNVCAELLTTGEIPQGEHAEMSLPVVMRKTTENGLTTSPGLSFAVPPRGHEAHGEYAEAPRNEEEKGNVCPLEPSSPHAGTGAMR